MYVIKPTNEKYLTEVGIEKVGSPYVLLCQKCDHVWSPGKIIPMHKVKKEKEHFWLCPFGCNRHFLEEINVKFHYVAMKNSPIQSHDALTDRKKIIEILKKRSNDLGGIYRRLFTNLDKKLEGTFFLMKEWGKMSYMDMAEKYLEDGELIKIILGNIDELI